MISKWSPEVTATLCPDFPFLITDWLSNKVKYQHESCFRNPGDPCAYPFERRLRPGGDRRAVFAQGAPAATCQRKQTRRTDGVESGRKPEYFYFHHPDRYDADRRAGRRLRRRHHCGCPGLR